MHDQCDVGTNLSIYQFSALFFFVFSHFFSWKKGGEMSARNGVSRHFIEDLHRGALHKSSFAKRIRHYGELQSESSLRSKTDLSLSVNRWRSVFSRGERERERAHPYARNVSRAIELAGFCMPLLKHVLLISLSWYQMHREDLFVRYKAKSFHGSALISRH